MSRKICGILAMAFLALLSAVASSEAAVDMILSPDSVRPLPPYGAVDGQPVFVKVAKVEAQPVKQVMFTGVPFDDLVGGLADRLTAMQDSTGGGWKQDITGISSNVISDPAMYNVAGGLLAAYQANSDKTNYLTAAVLAGDALAFIQTSQGWLYYEDVVFLYDLYAETGTSAYLDAADAAMDNINTNITAQGVIDHALTASQNVSYHMAWAALANLKAGYNLRAETILETGTNSLLSLQSSDAGSGSGSFLSKAGFVQETITGDLYGLIDTSMAIIALQAADNSGVGSGYSAEIDAALACIEGNISFIVANEGAIPDAIWWSPTGFPSAWVVPNWQYKSQTQGTALWAAAVAAGNNDRAAGMIQYLALYLQESVITVPPGEGGFYVRNTTDWSSGYPNEYTYDDALILRGLAAAYPEEVEVDATATSNGYNLFATIQEGIDGVKSYGDVAVAEGSYSESVTVTKPLTILGTGDAVLQGSGSGTGISIEGVDASVSYMDITGYDYGIDVDATGDATISGNNIYGHNLYGLRNQNTGVTVFAENNWWGANNGPDDDAGIINGSGSKISLYVDASPHKTGIALADTDGDGIPDGLEDLNGNGIIDTGETNPKARDSDGDGVDDGVEVALGSDPTDIGDVPASPPGSGDTDGDGYKDSYEVAMGTDMNSPTSYPELGDVNGSGTANNVDAIIIFQIALGNASITSFPISRMDINRDGLINNTDAIILFQWSLGNVATIPIP